MAEVGANRRSRVGRESSGSPGAVRRGRGNGGYRRNPAYRDSSSKESDSPLLEEETCLICADRIVYSALSPCNHVTCHKCTFRQRAKYEKKQCLICRSENEKVIFTENNNSEYSDYTAKDFTKFDSKHGVEFTSDQCYEVTMSLLKLKCRTCHENFESFKELSEHEKNEHSQYFCLICAKSKMVFVSELDLYNFRQLQRHQSEGDKAGFSGHPECKYCRGKRFYSDDELVVHVRERHERCFICDQDNPKTADYYRNYDSLYEHFRIDHYVCSVPVCIEKKFVVFRDDLDLTAHMLKEHGGLKSGAKVVVGSNRQFHSQLSTFVDKKKAKPEEQQDSPEIKRLRLEERARHYLNYNSDLFNEFERANSKYKNKSFKTAELVSEYERIFSHQSKNEIHLLLYEFAELFPKSTELHKSLVPFVEDLGNAVLSNKFPVLGGQVPTKGLTMSVHSWGGRSSSPSSQETMFPALSKPKHSSNTILPVQPIRYTTVVNKTNGKLIKPKVNSGMASPDYRPSYLDSKSNSNSTASLSSLNASSSSLSLSAKAPLDENKFPALEQRKPKKFVAPPVKPVVVTDPSQWGALSSTAPSDPEPEDYGIPITDKRKLKAKKKQEKQIFRI